MRRRGDGDCLFDLLLLFHPSGYDVHWSHESYIAPVSFLYVRNLGAGGDEGQMNIWLARSPRRLQAVVYDRSSE